MELVPPAAAMGLMGKNVTNLSDAAMALEGIDPFTFNDLLFAIRNLCYMWTPSQMMFKSLDEVPNMFTRVVRYMPLFILAECIGLLIRGKTLPRWNHSLMSVCTGIMVFLPGTIIGNIEFTWFSMLHEKYQILELPWNSTLVWIVCFFCCDLGSYLWHRAAHEVNFVWAYHSVHHTSDERNLLAAFRLATFNRQMAIMFYLPMAFFFHPAMFYTHYQLNYVSQVWVHTNVFDDIAEKFSNFIITPRLHGMHHARNRYCIDKNYGAVLSIWDHMFGTFAPYRKDVELSYGLVSNLQTFDPVSVQFKYFIDIFKRAASYDNWNDRVNTFIMGPGWEPGKPRLGNYEEIPKLYGDKPYNKTSPTWCYAYLTWTLILTILFYNIAGQTKQMLGIGTATLHVLHIFWTLANTGYFLEHKTWAPMSEVLRCVCYFLLEPVLMPVLVTTPLLLATLRYTSLLSLLIWSFKFNMFFTKDSIKLE